MDREAQCTPGLARSTDCVAQWANFLEVYRPLADHWAIYDNSETTPQLQERGP